MPDPVEQWLVERFRELGYIEPDALQLAAAHVDWHRIQALALAGCPLEVAARIVL